MTDDPKPRRDQIVAAVLDLLATTPLERVTTRAIAEAVGVSQPALFRHFASREALLLAVVEAARGELEKAIAPLVARRSAPLDTCLALAEHLAGYVEQNPGLPRLLFADMALEAPALRVAVAHLVSMQRTLVGELVAMAIREGSARVEVDPQAAATLFVGMMQGLVLQGDVQSLRARLRPVAALWRYAIASEQRAPVPAEPPRRAAAVHLDVRPSLARGQDPLAQILAALSELGPGSLLVVTAPFRPKPLEALLSGRGHRVEVFKGSKDTFDLVCVVGGAPALLDLRDLEPPLPMEQVLVAAERLTQGEVLHAHLPRYPRMLLPQLAQRGFAHEVIELGDGTTLLRVGARR